MNREETRKAAEVMMHYANGGEVECRTKSGGTNQWNTPFSHSWNWPEAQYRIKPKPVEVTCYAVLCNETHDGYFTTRSAADMRCIDLRSIGRTALLVELKGTYTCDT